ncbi:hypothetical protein BTN50_2084 [Candidatus Enterovibrio altilux]|uniref:Uncharacterized protein n=1 Tax=Candidatus Enterovibrio altilux TaxID=1927128 RepID=A0A291BBV9_9GAMM|nr:hypothetical protein BTN50_2084 [Candidatus Enterovibrio luxaltus]
MTQNIAPLIEKVYGNQTSFFNADFNRVTSGNSSLNYANDLVPDKLLLFFAE